MTRLIIPALVALLVCGPVWAKSEKQSETVKPFPTPFGQCEKPLKSGHIIFNCFGDWSVRKVFERGSKKLRYTDMKTNMRLSNGLDFTFQINRSDPTGWTVLLGGGSCVDRVEFEIDGRVKVVKPSAPVAKFAGYAEMDFYQAFVKAKSDIKIQIYTGKKYTEDAFHTKGHTRL